MSETSEPDNDNGETKPVCEFCHRPIFGKVVMDENWTPACEECAASTPTPRLARS